MLVKVAGNWVNLTPFNGRAYWLAESGTSV